MTAEPREKLELWGPWWKHPDGHFCDKRSLPCKNESKFARSDGGCLRCDADCGEACRMK